MYNYSKLLGRIKELDLTQARLAAAIGINKGTLSAKLNGKYQFTAEEMDKISMVLDFPCTEISAYFFTK